MEKNYLFIWVFEMSNVYEGILGTSVNLFKGGNPQVRGSKRILVYSRWKMILKKEKFQKVEN